MSLWDPQVHDDLLNYQLKRLVNLGGAPAIRLCEGGFGISRSEWRLLAALVEEGPRSPSDLARRCHFERARVSRLLGLLIEQKLVERVAPDGSAGRRTQLSATAKGRDVYERLFPQLAQINRRIVHTLTEDEAATLEGLLARVFEQVLRIHDEGDGIAQRADRWRGGRRSA
ncbi:MarR family winged helix-turn-helix transcriptional regulator [Variovorax sp. KK3]|uniref:MarR family winged helix-turn-helix transcriptional regulator n=1 Tax=Variovorax sp. KK3 TaxID=1855728 RepID=UPI00097C431F|nr:MarR family transcriptional regulator [Variovorax sp. KK3]